MSARFSAYPSPHLPLVNMSLFTASMTLLLYQQTLIVLDFLNWGIIALPWCVSFCCTASDQLCVRLCPLPVEPPSPDAHPQVLTEQGAELPALASRLPPAVPLLYYVSAAFPTPPTLSSRHPQCPQARSPRLYSCPARMSICTVFLDFIYIYVGSRVRHYWQNGGTVPSPLSWLRRHGPRMKELGLVILTCLFLSWAELTEKEY